MKKILITVISLFIMLLLSACSDDSNKSEEVVRPVRVLTVPEAKATITRYFPGRVNPNQQAQMSFQVTGQILQFPVKEGQKVKKNQLLVKMDPREFEDKVSDARARLNLTKAQFERAKNLVEKGYVSIEEYDQKRARYEIAKATLNTAERDLSYTELVAPFNGIIAKKYAENFEFVRVKQKILDIYDTDHIEIKVNVPESVLIRITNRSHSSNPQIEFDRLPGKYYPVSYKEHATEVDPETNTYEVTFILQKPENLNVLSGMTVTLKAELPDYSSGGQKFFQIPSSAVFEKTNGQAYVWIVDPKSSTVKKVKVEVSTLADNIIRVTKGIQPGEEIVISGVHYLKDDQKIRPLTDKRVTVDEYR